MDTIERIAQLESVSQSDFKKLWLAVQDYYSAFIINIDTVLKKHKLEKTVQLNKEMIFKIKSNLFKLVVYKYAEF